MYKNVLILLLNVSGSMRRDYNSAIQTSPHWETSGFTSVKFSSQRLIPFRQSLNATLCNVQRRKYSWPDLGFMKNILRILQLYSWIEET